MRKSNVLLVTIPFCLYSLIALAAVPAKKKPLFLARAISVKAWQVSMQMEENKNIPLLDVKTSAGGFSEEQRATMVGQRMQEASDTNPKWNEALFLDKMNGEVVLKIKGQAFHIFTVDSKMAKEWAAPATSVGKAILHNIFVHTGVKNPKNIRGDLREALLNRIVDANDSRMKAEALNSPEEKEKKFLDALAIMPDNPSVLTQLSEFYKGNGNVSKRNDIEGTIAGLKKVIDLREKGDVAYDAKDWTKAISCYEDAIKERDDLLSLRILLADALEERSKSAQKQPDDLATMRDVLEQALTDLYPKGLADKVPGWGKGLIDAKLKDMKREENSSK